MAKGGEWIVLRTGGPQTLPLVRSLQAAGFDVWSPTKSVSKRRPRSSERREIIAPVLPSYVFAKASHVGALMIEAEQLISPHPHFSVFRYCGKVPTISEGALENLRKIERRNMPEKAAREFRNGERVRLAEGGFAGMTGVVKTGRGRFTMVLFPGFTMPIKVKSMLLVDEADAQPQEIAA